MNRPDPTDSLATRSLAQRLIGEAPLGVDVELPRGGTALELAHVYDAVARDLLREAGQGGRIRVTLQEPAAAAEGTLIRKLAFRRLA